MIVEVSGLGKAFGADVVLDGIDLEVQEGSVVALLGPNGAGKTTSSGSSARSCARTRDECWWRATTSCASPRRCAARSA